MIISSGSSRHESTPKLAIWRAIKWMSSWVVHFTTDFQEVPYNERRTNNIYWNNSCFRGPQISHRHKRELSGAVNSASAEPRITDRKDKMQIEHSLEIRCSTGKFSSYFHLLQNHVFGGEKQSYYWWDLQCSHESDYNRYEVCQGEMNN